MKKLFLVAAALFTMTAAVLTGCQQATTESITMDSIINEGTSAEVDLSNIPCTENITVSRAVTIKNGDFGGKTLTVNVSGVTLENVKNVNVVVADSVGNGDFTVSGSDVASLKVLGGGANSIHVKDTVVSVITIVKVNVRVALEGKTSITKLQLQKGITAKVEVISSEVKIEAAEIVAEDGSKAEGESVQITVAVGVTFTAPAGATASDSVKKEEVKKEEPKQEEVKQEEPKQEEKKDNAAIPSGFYKVTYDSTNLKCWYYIVETGTDITVNSGDNVKEGTTLKFELKSNTGKVIDKWFVNEKETAFLNIIGAEWFFTLNASNISVNTVDVTYTLKGPKQFTINFEAPITCYYYVSSPSWAKVDVNKGDKVEEGTSIFVYANPEDGKIVDKWIVNGQEYDDYGFNYKYVTLGRDVTENTVTVSYTLKAAKSYKINFDASKMSCYIDEGNDNHITVNNGDNVFQNKEIVFTANLSSNKIITKWLINGNEEAASSIINNRKNLRLHASDITGDSVTATYTERDAYNFKVKFDSTITCNYVGKVNNNYTTVNVTSEHTLLTEGVTLKFTVTPSAGKTVDKLYVNDSEESIFYNSLESNYWCYTSLQIPVEGNTVNIRYTTK